jgi:hypothetical protein
MLSQRPRAAAATASRQRRSLMYPLLAGIREMYERYAPEGHGQTHYANLKRPEKADFADQENAEAKLKSAKVRHQLFVEDLKRYNIHCVDIDDYTHVEAILAEVEQRIALRSVFVSGSPRRVAVRRSERTRFTTGFAQPRRCLP